MKAAKKVEVHRGWRTVLASRAGLQKGKLIDPMWEARGDIVRLKTYRWSKPAFIVVGSGSLFLMLPPYFGSKAWELKKGDVVGLVPEELTLGSEQLKELAGRGVMSFETPYLFTTGPGALATAALQTWIPVVTPRFRFVAISSPNSPVSSEIWPGRRVIVYGIAVREELPGQLMEALAVHGWGTATNRELFLQRRPPFTDTNVLVRRERAQRWAWLLTFAPIIPIILAGVLAHLVGSVGPVIVTGALAVAFAMVLTPRSVKERRLRKAVKRALLPEIAAQLDTE